MTKCSIQTFWIEPQSYTKEYYKLQPSKLWVGGSISSGQTNLINFI